MNILVVAATTSEIRPFLEQIPMTGKISEQLTRFQHKKITVDALITGVGVIATAYFLGKQLALKRYDMVINAGIAGTFSRSIALGTVVNVTEDCMPEFGAEDGPKFISIFDLGLSDPDALPYTHGKLIVPELTDQNPVNLPAIDKLPRVRGITSSVIRGSADSILKITQLAPADIETMEGAAFFYVCLSEKVPCLQLRAISNYVEERNKANWDLNLALKNLNKVLYHIID